MNERKVGSMSELFNDIAQGLKEAIAYEEGTLPAKEVHLTKKIPAPPVWSAQKIKALRLTLPMSQRSFAAFMGVSVKTVEAWESGRNRPNGSAARLMELVAKDRNMAVL